VLADDRVGEDGQATMYRGFMVGVSHVPRQWTRCYASVGDAETFRRRGLRLMIAREAAVYGVRSGM